MKAINDNGTIKTFTTTPKTLGRRIGLQYASDSELEALGVYDVVIPEVTTGKRLGDIYFDSENEVFTYPLENVTFTQTVQELKDGKLELLRETYNSKLGKTDWYVTRKQEKGTAIPSDIQTERDDLRAEYESHKTAINALTTKVSIIDYTI